MLCCPRCGYSGAAAGVQDWVGQSGDVIRGCAAGLPMVTPCGLPPGALSPGAALAGLAQENAPQRMLPVPPAATPVPRRSPGAAAGPPDLLPFGSLKLNGGATAAERGGASTPAVGEPMTPKLAGSGGGAAAAAGDGVAVQGSFVFAGLHTPASRLTASGRPWPVARTPALRRGAAEEAEAANAAKRASQRDSAARQANALKPPASLMTDPQDVCRIQTT